MMPAHCAPALPGACFAAIAFADAVWYDLGKTPVRGPTLQMREISIRPWSLEDAHAVETLTREAFWNRHVPGCNEHYLTHLLRDSEALIRELSFVALVNGQVVGCILYTHARILCDDKTERAVVSFGPISVLPAYQCRGIGTALIEHTTPIAHAMGFPAILIYGDPRYYEQFGFVPAEKYGIGTADSSYAEALLAYELFRGALANCAGRFFEHEVFDLDEAAAEAFEQGFPPKERRDDLPSQQRFRYLLGRRRPRGGS